MALTGQQIKERLERDLGFESNRARLLAESAASAEISTYWDRKGLGKLDEKSFASLAKAALVSGLAGRQKLSDLVSMLVNQGEETDLSESILEISALVLEHQKTLNLSRNRASCVNAHLNVLDPDRSLTQIYSAYLSEKDLKSATNESKELLKRTVSNASDFRKWVKDVHSLLADVSEDEAGDSKENETSEILVKKGLISRKAITTYLKQWEMFALEKLGPTFSIEVREDDVSPLSGRLNKLENGATRTWTTIQSDITEAKTSTLFQKRSSLTTHRTYMSANSRNVENYELELSGRTLKIQKNSAVNKDVVSQFIKAMKAQFLVYSGKGLFNVSLQNNSAILTISLNNAVKSDLKKIEDILVALL